MCCVLAGVTLFYYGITEADIPASDPNLLGGDGGTFGITEASDTTVPVGFKLHVGAGYCDGSNDDLSSSELNNGVSWTWETCWAACLVVYPTTLVAIDGPGFIECYCQNECPKMTDCEGDTTMTRGDFDMSSVPSLCGTHTHTHTHSKTRTHAQALFFSLSLSHVHTVQKDRKRKTLCLSACL